MARPTQIKEETILEAARAVFLERGIRATTAEVALRAGVSEGSVFKRFKSKFDLFRAAMSELLEEPVWLKDLGSRVGRGEVRQNLIDVGLHLITLFRGVLPLAMLSWSNPSPEGIPDLLAGPNPPPLRTIRLLASYFEGEMKAGRLRRHDADLVARAFIGSTNHYVFAEVVLRENGKATISPRAYVIGLVKLFLTGLEVDAAKADRAPHAPRPAARVKPAARTQPAPPTRSYKARIHASRKKS